MTDQEYSDWLKNQSAIRCILVEVDVKVGASVTTRFLSNCGYVTTASDTPANTSYSPRIVGGIQISRKMSIDGNVSMSFGDIELNNTDGSLDSWVYDYWANRSIRIYLGDVTWARSDFRLMFSGITTGVDMRRRDKLNIKLSDKLQRLNYPVSELKLGGVGSLADSTIPLLFGECHNISPLLTDAVLNEYQVHPGPIEGVFEVRDNGVPVSFTHLPAVGKFRLNQAPSGTITCSAQGHMKSPNMVLYSQEFDNAYWTKTNCSVTANATAAPDGTTTADKLVENASGTVVHWVGKSVTFASGSQYTYSIYAKAAERSKLRLTMSGTVFTGTPNFTMDLVTGEATTVTDIDAYTIAALDNGWYRVSITCTCDLSGSGTCAVYPVTTTSTYLGDGVSGIYIWGAQVELAAMPSKYYPTVAASVNIFPRTVGEIVRVLCTEFGHTTNRLTGVDIDWSSLEDFMAANTQAVGLYIKDRGNVLDVCNQLASSIGARLVVNNDGTVRLVKLDLPQASPGTSVTAADMVSKSLDVSQLPPVVASVKIGYCKNWTVQDTLAAGLVAPSVALFEEEWLSVTRTDTAAAENYNLFTDPVQIDTLLLTGAEASIEADRRLDMFAVQRMVLKYTGFYHLVLENLGDSQTLTHDRFGLSGGKTGQIISITTDLLSPHVQFEVLV